MAHDDQDLFDSIQLLFYSFLATFLALYFIIKSIFAKYRPGFGHYSGIIVLLGILASFLIWTIVKSNEDLSRDKDEPLMSDLRFGEDTFFLILLPLIIFPSGYNMRRRKFFRNIKTICKFGFFSTFVGFTLNSGMAYFAHKQNLLSMWDKEQQKYVPLDLNAYEIMSVCALLCSSDVTASISQVQYEDDPRLYSLIYGEGVFNDIVSIILFDTIRKLSQNPADSFGWKSPYRILRGFIVITTVSVCVGFFVGAISSLLFKVFRSLTHSPSTETLLLLVLALISYYATDAMGYSGIIGLLTCGITMGHYTWHNLSPQGKTISSVTFTIFAQGAEAIVFSYIGLCTFTYADSKQFPWSPTAILIFLGIIVLGRFVALYFSHYLFKVCCSFQDVNSKELLYLTFSGMMRGAIAFGLVLRIPSGTNPDSDESAANEEGAMITTALALVILTTTVFGSLMPMLQRKLVPHKPGVRQRRRRKAAK